jgi:hypothetical protein
MSSIKDKLKATAKAKLAVTAHNALVPVIVEKNRKFPAEIHRITNEIRSELEEIRDIAEWYKAKKERVGEIKQSILEKLIYVRDNRKTLLDSRRFEDYLVEDIGITKGYFYEQLQAYSLCAEYKKISLFREIDPKILVFIAREEDKDVQKKLIDMAPSLTREYFKKSDVSDSSAPEKKKTPFVVKVNRDKLTIHVADPKILKQIETLLKTNGMTLEYQ